MLWVLRLQVGVGRGLWMRCERVDRAPWFDAISCAFFAESPSERQFCGLFQARARRQLSHGLSGAHLLCFGAWNAAVYNVVLQPSACAPAKS